MIGDFVRTNHGENIIGFVCFNSISALISKTGVVFGICEKQQLTYGYWSDKIYVAVPERYEVLAITVEVMIRGCFKVIFVIKAEACYVNVSFGCLSEYENIVK